MILWGISDGRAGHLAQVRGLMAALAEQRPCRSHEIPAPPAAHALRDLLLGRARFAEPYPDPDLVIGAGHATHLPLICARRARGGRSVVLMRPSLPLRCFDACIIPEHDDGAAAANVILSRGPLNRAAPADRREPGTGVIAVGGPSRHYRWDGAALLRQVRAVTGEGGRHWWITDSPRTPAATSAALAELAGPGIDYRPWRDTPPGRLQEHLGRCEVAWISEDSMSMVYEALSGGAPVGLLEVPARHRTRITRGVAALAEQGDVTRFSDWHGGTPAPARRAYREAERCAGLLLQRLGLQ